EFEESKHAAVFIHIQLAHRHTAVDDIADEYCRDERPCRKQNVRNQEVDIVEYGAAKDYDITQHTVGQCGRNSRQEYKQAESIRDIPASVLIALDRICNVYFNQRNG